MLLSKTKHLIKSVGFTNRIYTRLRKVRHKLQTSYKIYHLRQKQAAPFIGNADSNLIVSLTSFPGRIDEVWIVVESIFQQNYRPWKVLLTLSLEEFPNKTLPDTLQRQVERGLEVLWIKNNLGSYGKLLPAADKYPNCNIVTIDDDIIYEPWRIKGLADAATQYPACVVGYRGWEVSYVDGKFSPYTSWQHASSNTHPSLTFLTGVGGVLYPPNVLGIAMLRDIDAAMALAPRADDIWFWAVQRVSNTRAVCLGHHGHLQIRFDDFINPLNAYNCAGGGNDEQLENVARAYKLFEVLRRQLSGESPKALD